MNKLKSTQYTEKVMDHFRNPRNVGVIEKADGEGLVGNPVCGDLMSITIKVAKGDKDGEDIIEDIKFQTFGCGSAVATSSMVTTMAKGMKVDDAYEITRKDVAEELDGLPPIKMHCSNLAADALKAAIDNFRGKEDTYVEVEHRTCEASELKIVLGIDEFLGKGVYKKKVEDLSEFKNKRVLVIDTGDESLEYALELTNHTGRVIVVTSAKSIPGPEDLRRKIKRSDVKMIHQSELLEVMGTDDVEKVKILDHDEDENYELFIDVVIILEE